MNIEGHLKESDDVLLWVHANLDGLKISKLPDDKRTQLASACWHVAVEHAQAIVVLVHERLYGSASTMIRPLFEAFVRGLWLLHAASDDEVDRAGRDQFQRDFGKMIAELEKPGRLPVGMLSGLKGRTWSRLCSFTHTGYQQIGARLTTEGLGYDYQDSEILEALRWADMIALWSVAAFANLADNQPLVRAVLDRLRSPASVDEADSADPSTQKP